MSYSENEMKLHTRLNNLACRYETLENNYHNLLSIWNIQSDNNRKLRETIILQAKTIYELNTKLKQLEME